MQICVHTSSVDFKIRDLSVFCLKVIVHQWRITNDATKAGGPVLQVVMYVWYLCRHFLSSDLCCFAVKAERTARSERKRRDSFGMFDGYDSCSEESTSSSSSEDSEDDVVRSIPASLPIIKNNGQVYTYPDGKAGMGQYITTASFAFCSRILTKRDVKMALLEGDDLGGFFTSFLKHLLFWVRIIFSFLSLNTLWKVSITVQQFRVTELGTNSFVSMVSMEISPVTVMFHLFIHIVGLTFAL